MGTRPAGRQRWGQERLRAALADFLSYYPDPRGWPTSEELVTAGRADLRQAIKKHGGAAFWAAELGRELGPGQDRTHYSDAQARADAHALIDQLGGVPGPHRARRLGYARLASAMATRGGRDALLERLGLPTAMPPKQTRTISPAKKREAELRRHLRAIEDARAFVAEHGPLPNAEALRARGYTWLANYLAVNGGRHAFATANGLPSAS